MKKVNVLWTGGFDSTFRIVQLSKYDVVIQPYYLTHIRDAENNELKAITNITADIKKHPETKCKIQPLITFSVKGLKSDKSITDAYYRVRKHIKLGFQYVWITEFAKEQGIEFELCFEREPGSKALKFIETYGAVRKVADGQISYCVIDREKSTQDLITIFGGFHFPLPLFWLSKLETLEEYKKLGFESAVAKTWFCHTPINGNPCGLCNPCASTVESGMTFRLPPDALERYYTIRKKRIKWMVYRIKRRIHQRNFKFYF